MEAARFSHDSSLIDTSEGGRIAVQQETSTIIGIIDNRSAELVMIFLRLLNQKNGTTDSHFVDLCEAHHHNRKLVISENCFDLISFYSLNYDISSTDVSLEGNEKLEEEEWKPVIMLTSRLAKLKRFSSSFIL